MVPGQSGAVVAICPLSISQPMPYNNIVVLTGAGISAESGLKTFRDNNGLWENHRVEEVATPEAFAANPALVYRFYNLRRAQLTSATPNQAHFALVELEQRTSGNFILVTQNVDDLHTRAGSQNVLPMHGQLLKARCSVTQQVKDFTGNFDASTPCPCCQQQGNLRPHIVWFGEMPLYMDEIQQALRQADLFISIGTSGNVYPAAGFVQEALFYGAHTVEINLEPSLGQSAFAETHYGPATSTVPDFVRKIT